MTVKVLKQVTARWRPGDACRPILEDAPVFYPSEEVFLHLSLGFNAEYSKVFALCGMII